MTLAHQSEIDANSVTFAFADSRSNPAWHSAANKVWNTDEAQPSISDMLDSAKLSNWNIRLESVADYAPKHNRCIPAKSIFSE